MAEKHGLSQGVNDGLAVPEKFELYDLRHDMGETTDRAAREPQRLQAMAGALRKMYHEVRAESPVWPAWIAPPYEKERIKYFQLDKD